MSSAVPPTVAARSLVLVDMDGAVGCGDFASGARRSGSLMSDAGGHPALHDGAQLALRRLPDQLGRGHVHARRRDAQRDVDQLGHLGRAHRLLAGRHHEAGDRQHPRRQPLGRVREARRCRLLRRAHEQHALEAERHHGLLVEAGQAALQRLRQPALRMRLHDGQRLHAARAQPGGERRQLRRLAASTARARGRSRAAAARTAPARCRPSTAAIARSAVRRHQHGLDARQPVADRLARQHAAVWSKRCRPARRRTSSWPSAPVAPAISSVPGSPAHGAAAGRAVRGLQGLKRVDRHPSMLPSPTSQHEGAPTW